jgi:hypothetical protein
VAKVDYGIDAPGVVRNLAICGAALLIIRAFTPTIRIGPINIVKFEWTGSGCGNGTRPAVDCRSEKTFRQRTRRGHRYLESF